jgi:UDP-N-acetylmuramate--alanine ligase
VLAAARAGAKGRVIAIVEPHRYTRVQSLFQEFSACFKDADDVIVAPLYSAGESPIAGIDAPSLAAGIARTGHRSVVAVDTPQGLVPVLRQIAGEDDTVICFGAGNSTEWAHALPDWLAAIPLRAGSAV